MNTPLAVQTTIGAIALMLATAASAQTPFSSAITGTVQDASGGVVVRASVSLSGAELIGGAQAAVTNAEGGYRFAQLPSGEYDVAIEAAGFRPLKRVGVRVASGATVTLDHQLAVAGLSDAVIIRGEAPVVDVRNPGVPVRLDEDLLENLPTPRSIAGLINLVPGIASDVSFGGSQGSNEVLLDGVRLTGPLFQNPGVHANYNWVKEVNVVALGAPAEYGGFTGAAAFATLRSGSNQFSGLGEFWTTQPGWLSSNTTELSASLQRQFQSRQLLNWYDSSAQLGGPLIRNRLWFFSGLQYARHNDRPAGLTGPGSRDQRDRQFIVKPTASITPRLRLEGFIQRGTERVSGDALSAAFPIESSNDNWAPQTTWNSSATWTVNARTVAEARYGGYDYRWWSDPHPPGTIDGPYPRYNAAAAAWSQNTNYYLRDDTSVHTVSAQLTHHFDGEFGAGHEVKAGLEYEATFARQQLRYPGGRNYYDLLDGSSQVEVWAGLQGEATTGRNVVHVQDTWRVSGRLTLTPGVRFEWNRGSVPNQKNVFRTQTTAPRFGVAWDVTDDHRTVARLHYGRYFDAIFSSRIAQEDRSEVNQSVWYRIDGPDQWTVLSQSSSQDNFDIDPDLEHSHVDQLVLGVERELVSDISLQAQYIRRRFDTFMGLIDTGSIYVPIQLRDPGPDGRLATADDGELLDVFNLTNPGNQHIVYTNPEGAFNKYDALQLVGRKRFSDDWQLQGSYTWSENRGTVGNRWHVNSARFDLGQPGRFVNPNLGINAYGRASFDPTHEVKVLGSYRVRQWGGVMVSGVYRYMTGQAWSRTAVVTGFTQGSQRIRIAPQGTERLPAINRLDLRVEKTMPKKKSTLGLFADIFNVWNQGVPNSDVTEAVNSVSGPRFGQPNAWVDPRMLRVGLRASF